MLDLSLQDDLLRSLQDHLEQAAVGVDATRALLHTEHLIEERTARGEYLPGSSPGAGQYSTKPFARPAAGLPRRIRELLDDTSDGSSFFTRAGTLWVVVERGYRWLREAMGLPTDRVTLDVTGDMMRAMSSRVTTTADGITLEVGYIQGVSDDDALRIADFHQNQGVGPSKTIRRFVGLTDEEASTVIAQLAESLRSRLS